MNRKRFAGGRVCVTLGALLAFAAQASAQNVGMVSDWDDVASVFVFDAESDTVLGEVVVGAALDCEILDSQTLGFVAGWDTGIWVIDLTASPPALLDHPNNPIITSTMYVENLAITRDQQFLLICDGGGGFPPDPVTVVEIATLTEVSSIDTFEDHNSIVVCDNGSVLTTGRGSPWYFPHLRRFELDGFGTLTDTGESVHIAPSLYSAFARKCDYAVLHSWAGQGTPMISYALPGLAPVDTAVASGLVLHGLMHPAADLYYVRNAFFNTGVELWEYDQTTGQFGSLVAARALGDVIPYYGVEQMRMHPSHNKLYVLDDDSDQVRILDPVSLADIGSGSLPMPASFTAPSGIGFRTISTALAVDLEAFGAQHTSEGHVLVHWSTASEIDNAGFQIYRQPWRPVSSGLPTASATLLNPALIQAEGAPYQETCYRWRDESALPGEEYHYWLVDIDVHGTTTHHGPISVR